MMVATSRFDLEDKKINLWVAGNLFDVRRNCLYFINELKEHLLTF